jgi:hypothetical protein
MVALLRRAIDVNPRAPRNCLDEESPGGGRPKGAPPKRVNLPEGVKGDAQISRALVKVAMSRMATREDKEAVLAAEIALQLNPKNSPAVVLLTLAYLPWGRGGEGRGAPVKFSRTDQSCRGSCSAAES